MWAEFAGRSDLVMGMLDKGPYIGAQSNYGRVALISAAVHGRDERVKLLLEYGANEAIEDQEGPGLCSVKRP
jgi:ankyrin repeat protein